MTLADEDPRGSPLSSLNLEHSSLLYTACSAAASLWKEQPSDAPSKIKAWRMPRSDAPLCVHAVQYKNLKQN